MKLKETLYTPKTIFSMRANATINEPLVISKWQEEKFYDRILDSNEDGKPYYIHFGPPYANGAIHIGHGLNIVLKDFCHRIALQKGYYAPMIIGWDTHGLPIEHAILKKRKASLGDSVTDFRTKCRAYAFEQIAIQKPQIQRLGIASDLEQHYLTMNKEYEASQIQLFFALMQRGLVYRANKPIIWSWSSRSALAEAEVEYKDIESDSIYVLMSIVSEDFEKNTYALTWTTTPWTLPSNKAISFSGRQEYMIAQDAEMRNIILSKEAFMRLSEKLHLKPIKVLKNDKNNVLFKNTKYYSPLTGEICPFLSGDHVEEGQGSGLVHTAPAHGKDDYLVCKKHGIKIVSGIDERGHLLNERYKDVFYVKANKMIIQDLKDSELLLFHEIHKHSYPMDWRTGKPIVYMATTQWFINVNEVKKDILNILEDVNFYQPWARQRIMGMFENRDDWCISRQRRWGVPIAIYYDANKKPIIDVDLFKAIELVFEEEGSDSYYEKDFEMKLLRKKPKLKKYLSTGGVITKELDIMDVWLDSGVSHYSVMYKQFNVTKSDLYFEGIDQFRGWFNSSLVTSTMFNISSPYKAVATHGFVVDANGNKMSKSKGNGMKLEEVLKNFGIEVYRLYVASVDYSDNAKISNDILKQVSEQYRKIRNVFRFLLANLNGFTKKDMIQEFRPIDIYLMQKLDDLIETVELNFEKINFTNALRAINSFIVNDVSSLYFDISKDSLYVKEKSNQRRRQVLTIFSFLLDRLSRLLWPILPILVDDVWTNSPFWKENEVSFMKEARTIDLPMDFVNLIKRVENLLQFRKSFLHYADELVKSGACKKTSEITCNVKKSEIFLEFANEDIVELLQCARINMVENLNSPISLKQIDIEYSLEVNKNLVKCDRCWKYVEPNFFEPKKEEEKDIKVCHNCIRVLKADFPEWS